MKVIQKISRLFPNKQRTRTILILSIVAVFLTILTACRNPLVGLGSRQDIDPPEGDVKNANPGTYIRGIFQFEGTASDDVGINEVYAVIDGRRINGTVSNSAWSLELNTTEFDDGEKDLRFYYVDGTGKKTEERLMVIIDNTAPVLLVTSPRGYSTTAYTDYSFAIKGEAFDGPYGRIRQVTARVLQPGNPQGEENPAVASLTAPVGTSSWTTSFTNNGGHKTHRLLFVAEDYAGNTSQRMYHFDDLIAANGGTEHVPIDAVFSLENGNAVSGISITPEDLLSYGKSNEEGLPIEVNMTGDEPVITFINPGADQSAEENIMVPGGTVIATIEDDDALDVSALFIQFDSDDPNLWRPIDPDQNPSTNPHQGKMVGTTPYQFIRIEYPLDGLAPGVRSVRIKARDVKSVQAQVAEKTSEVVPFTIDSGAPSVAFTSPEIGDYLNLATFDLIEGHASDETDNIVQILLSLDDGENWDSASFTSSDTVDWSYSVSNWPHPLVDGPIAIRAKAVDQSGKFSVTNLQIFRDTQAPQARVYSPSNGTYVNGSVNVRVQTSDNTQLQSVEYVVGRDETNQESLAWIPVSNDLYNFQISVNTQAFENDLDSEKLSAEGDIWKTPIRVRVTDLAGNIFETNLTQEIHDDENGELLFPYYLFIDNKLDLPLVSILNPAFGASIGGSVTVAGSSFDDDGAVDAVFTRVDINTADGESPNFSDTVTLPAGKYIDFNGNGLEDSGERIIDESRWYEVAGTGSWSFELNRFGELYDTDGSGGHSGDIHVQVRARDRFGTYGSPPVERSFRVDDSIPIITNVNYASNDAAGGIITINGDVLDDETVKEIWLSLDNGISYPYPLHTLSGSVTHQENPYIDANGQSFDHWSLHHEVDTRTVIPESGILYLKLKALDYTNYQTILPITLNVDNLPPTITDTPGYIGQTQNLIGSQVQLMGKIKDVGSVSGIAKVEVYLERGGMAYNPDGSSTYTYSTHSTQGDVPMSTRNFDHGNSGSHSALYPDQSSAIMVIDSVIEQWDENGGNGDGDGYSENLVSGLAWDWGVVLDSTIIPDGSVNVHYVAYDHGGNTAHYVQPIALANNGPAINSLKISTDLNGDGDASDSNSNFNETEIYVGPGAFTVRNDLFVMTPTVSGGNGTLSYALFYDTPLANIGSATALKEGTFGEDLTISLGTADFAGIPDGENRPFLLQITDSAQLTAIQEFSVDVANTDSVAPTARLFHLNQGSVTSAAGRTGRLQPAGLGGGYNNNDADVSGTVLLTGRVSDDQRIQNVTLQIDGLNGGNPFDLFVWDDASLEASGGLKAPAGVNAEITSWSFTESSGHIVDFTYQWNTEEIATTAQNNVDVKVRVTDFGNNASPEVLQELSDLSEPFNSMTVDVMPYITTILLNDSTEILRTQKGRYPVPEGTGTRIVLRGYNLGTAENTATVSLTGQGGASSTDLIGNQYANNGDSNADWSQQVSVLLTNLDGVIENSGLLALKVNEIPMMNHSNDNSQTFNQEANPSGTLWNDDRYLSVWKVDESITGSSGAVHGALTANPLDGGLWASWSEYSDADVYIANNTAQSEIFHKYDPAEYTDIGISEAGKQYVVYLANFFGGGTYDGAWNTGSGGLVLWGENAELWDGWNGNPYSTNRLEEVERFSEDKKLWQFQNPRMFVNGDIIHISYYDSHSNALKYARFSDDGTSIYNLTFSNAQNTASNNREYIYENGKWDENIVDGTEPSTDPSDVGEYSDITVDKDGKPVIVYYDTKNSALKLAYATGETPPTDHSAEWTTHNITNPSSYIGKYPSVRVDSENTAHVTAYKVSTGDLMYFQVQLSTGSVEKTEIVDSVGNVGAQADLDLLTIGTQDIPVVGYLNSSNVGTFQGLKYALREGEDDWEQGTVPLFHVVDGERISTAAWPKSNGDRNYDMAIGFHSNEYRYVQLRPEL